jgi:hypothetical protein
MVKAAKNQFKEATHAMRADKAAERATKAKKPASRTIML